jgi:hypothetical protein
LCIFKIKLRLELLGTIMRKNRVGYYLEIVTNTCIAMCDQITASFAITDTFVKTFAECICYDSDSNALEFNNFKSEIVELNDIVVPVKNLMSLLFTTIQFLADAKSNKQYEPNEFGFFQVEVLKMLSVIFSSLMYLDCYVIAQGYLNFSATENHFGFPSWFIFPTDNLKYCIISQTININAIFRILSNNSKHQSIIYQTTWRNLSEFQSIFRPAALFLIFRILLRDDIKALKSTKIRAFLSVIQQELNDEELVNLKKWLVI